MRIPSNGSMVARGEYYETVIHPHNLVAVSSEDNDTCSRVYRIVNRPDIDDFMFKHYPEYDASMGLELVINCGNCNAEDAFFMSYVVALGDEIEDTPIIFPMTPPDEVSTLIEYAFGTVKPEALVCSMWDNWNAYLF